MSDNGLDILYVCIVSKNTISCLLSGVLRSCPNCIVMGLDCMMKQSNNAFEIIYWSHPKDSCGIYSLNGTALIDD